MVGSQIYEVSKCTQLLMNNKILLINHMLSYPFWWWRHPLSTLFWIWGEGSQLLSVQGLETCGWSASSVPVVTHPPEAYSTSGTTWFGQVVISRLIVGSSHPIWTLVQPAGCWWPLRLGSWWQHTLWGRRVQLDWTSDLKNNNNTVFPYLQKGTTNYFTWFNYNNQWLDE